MACNTRSQRWRGPCTGECCNQQQKKLLEMMALSIFLKFWFKLTGSLICSTNNTGVPSTFALTVCNPAPEFVRNWCHHVLVQETLEWGYKACERRKGFLYRNLERFLLTHLCHVCKCLIPLLRRGRKCISSKSIWQHVQWEPALSSYLVQ